SVYYHFSVVGSSSGGALTFTVPPPVAGATFLYYYLSPTGLVQYNNSSSLSVQDLWVQHNPPPGSLGTGSGNNTQNITISCTATRWGGVGVLFSSVCTEYYEFPVIGTMQIYP